MYLTKLANDTVSIVTCYFEKLSQNYSEQNISVPTERANH